MPVSTPEHLLERSRLSNRAAGPAPSVPVSRERGGATASPGPGFPGELRPGLPDVLLILAPVLAWLVVSLFLHPLGDHYTESDFYGAYADGARAILRGQLDPRRYGIYGPVYEWVIAGFGRIGFELFRAAGLLSVLAAGATLAAWWAIARVALGRGAARAMVLLVACTPVFSRYAYSATTDMLAAALGSWAVALLLLGRGPGRLAIAGGLAALAILTRYQALVLLPIAATVLWFARRESDRHTVARRAGAFVAGFLVLATPWLAFSLSRGFVPGQGLVGQYGFYVIETGARNVQDQPGALMPPAAGGPAESSPPSPTLGDMLTRYPWRTLQRLGARAFEHLGDDARVLLGPGFALLALTGALLWGFAKPGRLRAPVAATGLLLYLGLLPAFYSDRYRLMLIPVYALGAAACWPALARRGRRPAALAVLLLAAVAAPLFARNVELQSRIHRELPRDVLQLAPALAEDGTPGPVMSRKGHLGYYAHRPTVPFPRAGNLEELARSASASGARFLYYSWYEAQLRPEFLCLLDTTRVLPGLERVAVSAFPAGVLYRIGPGFGEPGWYADLRERAVSEARGSIWALSDSAAARGRAVLAADAYLNGEPAMARALARRSMEVLPHEPLARSIDSLATLQLAQGPATTSGLRPANPREARQLRRSEAHAAWREWLDGRGGPGGRAESF